MCFRFMLPYLESQAEEEAAEDAPEYIKKHHLMMRYVVRLLRSLDAAGVLG